MQPWMDLDLCQSSCCSLLITRAGSPGAYCLTRIQIILKPAKTHSSLMGAHYHERCEPQRLKRKTASGTLMMSASLLSLCYLLGWRLHPRTTLAAFKHSWCLKPNSEERKQYMGIPPGIMFSSCPNCVWSSGNLFKNKQLNPSTGGAETRRLQIWDSLNYKLRLCLKNPNQSQWDSSEGKNAYFQG